MWDGEYFRHVTPKVVPLSVVPQTFKLITGLYFERAECTLRGQSGRLPEVLERLIVLEPKEDIVSSCNSRSC